MINRFTSVNQKSANLNKEEKVWVELVMPVTPEAIHAISCAAPPDSKFRYIEDGGVKKLRISWIEEKNE